MTLTKADIVESLITQVKLSRPDARSLVDDMFAEIRECLAQNEDVKLSGFGNFELREKKQRPGRNPKTGERVEVPEKHVPHFKPGKELRERVDLALQQTAN